MSFPQSLSSPVGDRESFLKKDCGQAAMTKNSLQCRFTYELISNCYCLEHISYALLYPYSMPFMNITPAVSAAVLYFCHSGLSRIFLVIPNKSKDSRQAGMTPKINIQFSDALRSLPQGNELYGLNLNHSFVSQIFDYPVYTFRYRQPVSFDNNLRGGRYFIRIIYTCKCLDLS